MSRDGVTLRLHKGGETQEPDPFIAAKMGAANTPAYRGTAYVVFEELPLERFGNRLPQLSFEVFRPILDGESAESLVRAVTLIPASGEFAYATEIVRREGGDGETSAENVNAEPDAADLVGRARPAGGLRAEGRVGLARRRLVRRRPARRPLPHPAGRRGQRQGDDAGELVGRTASAAAPRTSSAATTRAARPTAARRPTAPWCRRSSELKARGYRVTFYPFILMDVAAGQRRCRTRTATTPPRPASRPIPGAGGSPARRPPGYAGSAGQERRRRHAGRRLLRRRRSRRTSTSTTSGSSGTAIPTTGACGG